MEHDDINIDGNINYKDEGITNDNIYNNSTDISKNEKVIRSLSRFNKPLQCISKNDKKVNC